MENSSLMPSLTKNDIVEMIEERNELPKRQATKTVETMLEILKTTLESGESGSDDGDGLQNP
jgi:nucleoid DNA-binding protein